MSEQPIDEEALGRWLEANVEGFIGPIELTKFPSGQSNPTYRIRAASGDYVLRAILGMADEEITELVVDEALE